jgi:co-chaperonin GroES (HSP10)
MRETEKFAQDAAKRAKVEHLDNRLLLRQEGNKVIVGNYLALEIKAGDNIMILEDEYVDGIVCKDCKGQGKLPVSCIKCEGSGWQENPETSSRPNETLPQIHCTRCAGAGNYTKECKVCNGTGKSIVLAPQAVAKPTSGKIVSMGPDCSIYAMNDRVAYSGYTGHLLPFKGNNRLRVMGEREPFCLITNLTQDTDQGQETKIDFVDQDTAYKME